MINSYRSSVDRLTREKAKLEQDLSKEREKSARIRGNLSTIVKSLTSSISLSTLKTKQQQMETKEKEYAQIQKKIGEIEVKISQKLTDINRTLENLERAEEQERKKQDNAAKKRRDDEITHVRAVTREKERQVKLGNQLGQRRLIIDVARLPETIKVLFVAANPEASQRLQLDEEIRAVTEKIRASEHRDSVELVACWAARTSDLIQALNQHRPHVIHFSGHGTQQGDLLFVGNDGEPKRVTKDSMAATMAVMADNIKLVLFNACFSEAQAKAVTQHVDLAIGMTAPIGDEAARVFAAHFYSAIGFGHSVRQAFEQARLALLLDGGDEAGTPQLFAREDVDPTEIILVRPPTSY